MVAEPNGRGAKTCFLFLFTFGFLQSIQAMVNADFLIAWPNAATATGPASVPWTITHRQSPNGEQQPLLAGPKNSATSTTKFFTYLPALSSTDLALPYTVVSYLRLLTMPADYPSSSTFKSIAREKTSFIYASSTFQPQNVAEDATLTQHDQVSKSSTGAENFLGTFFLKIMDVLIFHLPFHFCRHMPSLLLI